MSNNDNDDTIIARIGDDAFDEVKRLVEAKGPGAPLDSDVMDTAAGCGRLRIVKYLWSLGHRMTEDGLTDAATNGFLYLLKWVHAEKGYWDGVFPASVMDAAAGEGFLEIVQWLDSIGAPCTTDAMDDAAGNGHYEVVRWLHMNREEGYTIDGIDKAWRLDDDRIYKFLTRYQFK